MRRNGAVVALIALLHALVLVTTQILAHQVVPGWKKGPLIDPAAPYAPENAYLIFGVALCVFCDLYVAGVFLLRRRFGARGWVAFVAMLSALAVTESGVQVYIRSTAVTYFRPHPVYHWQVRPNLAGFQNNNAPGRIFTNGDGLRDVTVGEAKPADELRVLILGDSSNFGHGVDGPETLSAQLQRALTPLMPAGRHVVVLNGACPGWTTYQGVEFLARTGARYDPDLVVAGFNNDPGPDYLGDRARLPTPAVAAVETALFKLETYLLSKEVLLASLRRFLPPPSTHYEARTAGEKPRYDKLSDEESAGLVPRVSLPEFVENLRALDATSRGMGARFAWINMPVNRLEPGLVERYVNWTYRETAKTTASAAGFLYVDADGRWQRTREDGLHQAGHVFHPNAKGHGRLAEQVAAELVAAGAIPGANGSVRVGGPPPASSDDTVRFAISSLTPVHAHVAAVLQAMPELAREAGLDVEVRTHGSGKEQGEDVARGAADAFFSCEVPAVQMVGSRSDARIVASPGELGRIAVVAPVAEARALADLRGAKVGVAKGSTPHMDWQLWGKDLGATEVYLPTEGLEEALATGQVDAIVTWDPWVADVLLRHGDWGVVTARTFRSDLAVGIQWAVQAPKRAAALRSLVGRALALAAADRPRWDAEVARLSGWPVAVVKAVADQNVFLTGTRSLTAPDYPELALTEEDRALLGRAVAFTRSPVPLDGLVAPELLEGRVPPPRNLPPPKGGPPPGGGPARPAPQMARPARPAP